jgi:hypothetical protein
MTINRWFATLERFLTVSSVPELTHLLTQTCRQAGFDSVVLGLQNRNGAQSTAPRLDASTTISDPWNAHYAYRRYYEFDPRIAHCLQHRALSLACRHPLRHPRGHAHGA